MNCTVLAYGINYAYTSHRLPRLLWEEPAGAVRAYLTSRAVRRGRRLRRTIGISTVVAAH